MKRPTGVGEAAARLIGKRVRLLRSHLIANGASVPAGLYWVSGLNSKLRFHLSGPGGMAGGVPRTAFELVRG